MPPQNPPHCVSDPVSLSAPPRIPPIPPQSGRRSSNTSNPPLGPSPPDSAASDLWDFCLFELGSPPNPPNPSRKCEASNPGSLKAPEEGNMSTTIEQAKKEYEEFTEKVKRTVYIDNMSPAVNDSVIKTALGQFGNVINIEFIPNYTVPYNIPQCALVEMETKKQAADIIKEITNFPFMMSGMPRPVRAAPAKAEMFANRPIPPKRKIQFCWVDPNDPDFDVSKKLKRLCKKQTEEYLSLVKLQLEEEEKLAKSQSDMLKANYKKHEMIEGVVQDNAAKGMARKYGIKGVFDDRD